MLQKYYPVLGEVNSPLAALVALQFTSEAAKVAIEGISNSTLENLLWASVEDTEVRKAEIEVSASELEAARRNAAKQARYYRYRAAMAARNARAVSKNGRKIKAVRKPIAKGSLKSLKGLDINICRTRAAVTQASVYAATAVFNAAHEAVESAIQGGDTRAIRTSVAALKAAVRTLEVRHLEFRFAREMLSIALARHSA